MMGPGLEMLHLRKDLERGTWSYTDTANPTDRGTVVDFMCKHEGATLATCLRRLGGCVFRSHLSPEGIVYQEAMRDRSDTLHAAVAVHLAAVKAEREAIRGLEGLGVSRAAFDETRFGRLRDSRDVAALLRNPTRLEHSRYLPTDRQVVLVERPLDAIAYEQKHGKGRAGYAADPLLEEPERVRVRGAAQDRRADAAQPGRFRRCSGAARPHRRARTDRPQADRRSDGTGPQAGHGIREPPSV
jgi:hypothetical protein